MTTLGVPDCGALGTSKTMGSGWWLMGAVFSAWMASWVRGGMVGTDAIVAVSPLIMIAMV